MWPNPDPAAPQHLGQYIAILGLPWGPLPATGTLPCCGGPHLSRGPSWPWGPIPAMGTISSTGTMAILGTPPCHGGPHPCHGGRHPPREHSQPRRSLPGPPLARLPPEFLPGPPLPVPSGPPYPPRAGPTPGLTHFLQGSAGPAGTTGAVRRGAGLLGGGTSLPAADHCAGPVPRYPRHPRFPRFPRCSRSRRCPRPVQPGWAAAANGAGAGLGLGGPVGTGAGRWEVPGGATFQPGRC